jgi:F-type H+-transporting ATPase subunit delta
VAKTSSAAQVIAQRYAGALIEVASTSQLLEEIERDMQALSSILTASKDFKNLISSPLSGSKQQIKICETISETSKFQKLSRNFLQVLVDNRRLSYLPIILKSFSEQMSKRRGEIKAQVQSAMPLSPEQERALQDSLKKSLGFKVQLETRVQKDLLGGLVVTVGSHMIDDSIKGKLERLRQALQGNSNQNTKLDEVG